MVCFFLVLYDSHELRTPMAAVIGLLDILISDDCLTNEQYSTVTQIRKCSTALLRLLNNILDLSKVCYITLISKAFYSKIFENQLHI